MPLLASHCLQLIARLHTRCVLLSPLYKQGNWSLHTWICHDPLANKLTKQKSWPKPMRLSAQLFHVPRGSNHTGEGMPWFTQHSHHYGIFLSSSCLTKSVDGSVYDMQLNLGLTFKLSLLNNPWYLLYKEWLRLQLWDRRAFVVLTFPAECVR